MEFKWIVRLLLLFITGMACACKECEAIEEGYIHFRIENVGTVQLSGTIYIVGDKVVLDSLVFKDIQPSKIGMGTVNLKEYRYTKKGSYRIALTNMSQSNSITFGSFDHRDDYFDTYVWKGTENGLKDLASIRTPCE